MRHVPLGIFAIIAILGIATLMLSVTMVPEPSFMAVQFASYPRPPSGTGDTIVVRLDVGEFLGNEFESATEAQFAGLRSGTVHGKEINADYVQSLRFQEIGKFNGCVVTFGRGETRKTGDFLQCNDYIFKYQVDFSPGLRSDVVNGELRALDGEDLFLLGDSYTIVDTDVNLASNSLEIRMFGGFGVVDLEDANYLDDEFHRGVKINGQSTDALVKMKAIESGDQLTIYTIQYLLPANAAYGGQVEVRPLHCVREYLKYAQAMLSPNFDICYKGLTAPALPGQIGVAGNQVEVEPLGNDEYIIVASNTRGRRYEIPLAQLPGSYGIKGRDFIFKEAANEGAPNIEVDDYFLVTHKDDVNGVSNVLRYKGTHGNQAEFEDLSTGGRMSTFDPATGKGQLLQGEGTYRFVVGPGDALAMDQTNDGKINGGEARFIMAGGTKVDFGPGFTVKIITPRRLFDDAIADEVTKFKILFGSDIDLNVPSPQTTLPGYKFKLQSQRGYKQGLTKYGILFTWDTDSDSDSLTLTVPGSYSPVRGGATGDVFISLDRPMIMRPAPVPQARCGDRIITKPEYCDPPGSLCSGPGPFERGTCALDCMSCVVKPPAVCGNNLLENGEQCEAAADCPEGYGCNNCVCAPLPAAVCGNQLLEPGEQCEAAYDCAPGMTCTNCACTVLPVIEEPASVPELNWWQRFISSIRNLFGW